MAIEPVQHVLQHLRETVWSVGGGDTDGELLSRFLVTRDELALASLMRRHADMVWAVCRRLLHNHHDAEDAFQATFLVLVRKAATIRNRELLANWLHGVAHQTAVRLRSLLARRAQRERVGVPMPEPAAVSVREEEISTLLDQELARLPNKYRAMIVLCDLEGRTRKEVAQQLECAEGTIASRLARARQMLATRLARRGMAVSAPTLAAALSSTATVPGVPAAVVSSTIQAVHFETAGQTTMAGVVSAQADVLARGVIDTMFLNKLGRMAGTLLLCLVTVGGSGILLSNTATAQRGPGAGKVEQLALADAAESRKAEDPVEADMRKLRGVWEITTYEGSGKKLTREELDEVIAAKLKRAAQELGRKDEPGDRIGKAMIVFDARGNWKLLADRVTVEEGSSKLDPSKKLKAIDTRAMLSGTKVVVSHRGIYEFPDEDTCRICRAPGEVRAKAFTTSQAGGETLWVLKRIDREERNALRGTWQAITSETDGLRSGPGRPEVTNTRLVFSESTFTLYTRESTAGAEKKGTYTGTYTLGPNNDPRGILLTWKTNPWNRKDFVQHGIFQRKGTSLDLCLSHEDDRKFPTDFSANFGTKRTLLTFERVQNAKPPQSKDPPEAPVSGEVPRLSGNWKVVALEVDGVVAPVKELAGGRWEIRGKEVRFVDPGKAPSGLSSLILDPGQNPPHFDIVGKEGGKKITGIYKIDKDRLTICLGHKGTRPKKFESSATQEQSLFTLERITEE